MRSLSRLVEEWVAAEVKHTAGPWEAIEWACHAKTTIVAAGGLVIAECGGQGRLIDATVLADAAFIVRAVNNFAQLLSALEFAEVTFSDYSHGPGGREAMRQIRAAIVEAQK